MKRLFLLPFLLIFFWSCSQMNYKTGNDFYKQEAYSSAIPYFQKVIDKGGNPEAFVKIADCYRNINNSEGAEKWYARVVDLGIHEPEHWLYYAQALNRNGKYEEAKIWYNNYLTISPEDQRAINALNFLEKVDDYVKHSARIDVSKLSINSDVSDFGPSFYKNGIIFCSERNDKENKIYNRTGRPFVDMFYSKFGPLGDLMEPVPLSYQLNTEYHDGPGAYNGATGQLFITKSYLKNNHTLAKSSDRENNLQLFVTTKKGSSWGPLREFVYNNKEYSTGHPSVSEDGTVLYYISDRPGGKGGTDLYQSNVTADGTWSAPENLGNLFNTPGDEMFPFYIRNDNGEQLLYFASDGHQGPGGLDIFVSKLKDGSWTKPEILPSPINSTKDDFGLITGPKEFAGYFSSNRETNGELDNLYRFGQKMIHIAGLVIDQETGAPLPETDVEIQFDGSDDKPALDVNDEARFHFDMEWNDAVDIFASLENYLPERVNISGTESISDTIYVTLELDKLKDAYVVLIGTAKNAKTGQTLSKVDVDLLNNNTRRLTSQQTDQNGRFEFTIAPKTNYVVTGKKKNFYLDRKKLTTTGVASYDTVYVELNLTPFEMEQPIALDNIYYDLDKWFIRQDAAPELNKLAQILRDNPEITIELMSHTDSRASTKYNQRLSQKRANSAIEYLTSRGIATSRMVAQGYGESQLLNRCSNGVKCTEAEHQENRRTEFKIIKVDQIILSKPKNNMPVNTGLRAED